MGVGRTHGAWLWPELNLAESFFARGRHSGGFGTGGCASGGCTSGGCCTWGWRSTGGRPGGLGSGGYHLPSLACHQPTPWAESLMGDAGPGRDIPQGDDRPTQLQTEPPEMSTWDHQPLER